MKFIKLVTLLGVTVSSLYCKEVSVFDAGNINSNTPYGLTQSEKALLENKGKIDSLNAQINTLKTDIEELKEQIEGMRSVLEGSSNRVLKTDSKINTFEDKISNYDLNMSFLAQEISELKNIIEENKKIKEEDYKKIRGVLSEISSLIDFINGDYLSKSKFEEYKKSSGSSKPSSESKNELSSKESLSIMKEADNSFKENNFEEAKKGYEVLLKRNYRPAKSNYYLGEIAYNQKSWKTAIEYYQKSIQLYDKADYIPKLLYHTAISFDKLGLASDANKFYNALKTDYPDTNEAKASPNR